jgi:hypothetical protein
MQAQFEKYGIRSNAFITERYTEIKENLIVTCTNCDKNSQQTAAVISHLNNLRHWYTTTNEPYAIFCEDDISFESIEYWSFTWNEFMQHLPENWECVQLLRAENDFTEKNLSNFKLEARWGRWWGSHCLLKRSYVKKLLDQYCFSYNHYNLVIPGEHAGYYAIVENVLFLGFNSCINVPLLVDNLEFQDPNERNSEYLLNQSISSKLIIDLWKKQGKDTKIEDLLKL